MSLTDSNKKKNYSNKTSNNTKVAKVITITDKLLLKKLQREGGNIRKSKLKNKKIFDTLGKKEFNKYKKRVYIGGESIKKVFPNDYPIKKLDLFRKLIKKNK